MIHEKSFFRGAELALRESAGHERLVGYAVVWNSLSENLFGFRERVLRGAFTKTLERDDQVALWNHDAGQVLGRKSAGNLELVEDTKGLKIWITPPDTQTGRDAVETVRRGDVTQMSFGFKVVQDHFVSDELGDIRELLEVDLFEVSLVAFPAYTETEVGVREKLEAIELRRKVHGLPPLGSGRRVRLWCTNSS